MEYDMSYFWLFETFKIIKYYIQSVYKMQSTAHWLPHSNHPETQLNHVHCQHLRSTPHATQQRLHSLGPQVALAFLNSFKTKETYLNICHSSDHFLIHNWNCSVYIILHLVPYIQCCLWNLFMLFHIAIKIINFCLSSLWHCADYWMFYCYLRKNMPWLM